MSTLLRWSYADHAIEARKLRGDTEKEWIAERNEQFKKLSKKVGMEACPTKIGCTRYPFNKFYKSRSMNWILFTFFSGLKRAC